MPHGVLSHPFQSNYVTGNRPPLNLVSQMLRVKSTEEKDNEMKWLLPPILVGMCLIAMLVLAAIAPLSIILPVSVWWLGLGVMLTGILLLMSAAGLFRKVETNINTFRNPDKLVTTGPFSVSRNPMYLGFSLLLLGVALLLNTLSALLITGLFVAAANFWYIPFEEAAAEQQFGQAYLDYKEKVRRWL